MRLIDADAFDKTLEDAELEAKRNRKYVFASALNIIRGNLRNAPTIEERKKGKWIHDGYDHPHGIDWMHCSECGRRDAYVPASMTNYCPNCGARMES